MQVILKPVSNPGLGEIIVKEALFPVGRHEAPFSSYDKEIVANLSRRHARIFEESGGVYVADLGSRNGTRVNGQSVAFRPRKLRRGDKIAFANKLEYEVEILGQAADTATGQSSPVCLTLVPNDEGSELEPIIITRFPFLISKSDEAFSRYSQVVPDEVNYLSRRHAHIFVKANRLYIEDLGSTNGTYCNGERLDEHARSLKTGASLAFGGKYFAYTVKLQTEEEALTGTQRTASGEVVMASEDAAQGCKTTFVSTANSFLDIFCVQEDEQEHPPTAGEDEGAQHAQSGAAQSAPKAGRHRFRKARALLAELRGAFAETTVRNPRRLWLSLGIVLLAGVVAASVYLLGEAKREIRGLLAQGDYVAGAQLAHAYLQTHPHAQDVRNLAAEALMKYSVPQWIGSLESGDFEGADAVLSSAGDISQANEEGLELLELLGWVGELNQFMSERGGTEAPIEIYKHEDRIEALLEWWDADKDDHRRLMGLVLSHVPEFDDVNSQAFSHLRALRSEESVYLPAIDKLKAAIEEKIDADRAQDLGLVFEEFAQQYPRIGGLRQLEGEWQNYLAVQEAIEADDLQRAMNLIDSDNFMAPPFKAKIAELQANALPPREIAQQYQKASDAWRAGRLDETFAILERLINGPWGKAATGQLERKRQIVRDHGALGQAKGSADYAERLLAFYNTLHPKEDVYFLQMIERDVHQHSASALKEADQAWGVAQQRWKAYQRNGGIRGLYRLEKTVSATFKRQARLLTEAYNNAQRSLQVYAMLNKDHSPDWKALHQEIRKEANYQRRSLKQLSMVLSPSLLDDKLDLIVEPQAEQWNQ